MAELTEIVDVVISATPNPVTQAGFGMALILGTHVRSAARYEVFANLSALGQVHPSTSEIYKAAAKYFAQSPSPDQVAVGRRQADSVTLVVASATDGAVYVFSVNGQDFSLTYNDATPTVAEATVAE